LLVELSARRSIATAQTDVLDHLAGLRRVASSCKRTVLERFDSADGQIGFLAGP
jgi:hypothetical protein